LFAWIADEKKKPTAFAARFGGSTPGWEIFLDALCGMGLLRKRAGKYSNGSFALRNLAGPAVASLLPSYDALRRWSGLAPALISGKRPHLEIPFLSDRTQTRSLLRSLDLDAQEIAPYLVSKIPLKSSKNLLDVGGGLGTYSVAFCRRYPKLEATLVEHPNVVPLARKAIREAGMSRRIRVVEADVFHQPLPGGFDAVLLSNMLHAHGARENRLLISKIYRCLTPHGRLILRDVFMRDDRTTPEWGALFSVSLFLHAPRGRCYTIGEITEWLRRASFSQINGPFRSSPLSFDPDSVLIARP
jgi:ubiquinone/menaquinone biosynthesis C-methylase UbiE